jgi:4,4'-diaponeurosporenoate glycosyltransferase
MKFIVKIILWLLGFFLLWKIPICKKPAIPSAQMKKRNSSKSVSVIIPARNEEGIINKLLLSLQNQSIPPYEVIVVNDGSDDRTGAVARQLGATVINIDTPPDGWVGKNWACYTGAKNASGSYLLFLDADTWLEADGLERIIACEAQHPGVITISPYHHIEKSYENLSLFFNIMAGAGLRTFTMLENRIQPAGLFGPCFYCSREKYFKIDGHASVKGSIVEDVEIGKTFIEAGIPLYGFGGRETLSIRMYPHGLKQLTGGWTKNIGVGARLTSPIFVVMISLWFAGAFHAAVSLLSSIISFRIPSLKFTLLYSVYAAQIYWMSRRVGNFHTWANYLFPIPLFFSGYIYIKSFLKYALKKEVKWKGRSLSTEETAKERSV